MEIYCGKNPKRCNSPANFGTTPVSEDMREHLKVWLWDGCTDLNLCIFLRTIWLTKNYKCHLCNPIRFPDPLMSVRELTRYNPNDMKIHQFFFTRVWKRSFELLEILHIFVWVLSAEIVLRDFTTFWCFCYLLEQIRGPDVARPGNEKKIEQKNYRTTLRPAFLG